MASPIPPARRVEALAALAALRLPRAALVRLTGGARITRDGCVLDEQVQGLLAAIRLVGAAPLAGDDLEAARDVFDVEARMLVTPTPQLPFVRDEVVSPRVTVRVYRPAGLGDRSPAVLFVHGGGFALGSLDSHDPVCRHLACDVGCVVVAVHYRRAPEHPFPAAADDATEAFRWLVREAPRLGVDPARIAVAGDSAGGNLAAVVCLDTRDEPARPRYQALVYPVVDQTQSFASLDTFAEGFLLERRSIDWFRECYVPDPATRRDPRASPWFADASGLPPALVQTGGFDPLRDEGEAWAAKLRDAGCAVEARRYPALVHGWLGMLGTIDAAREPWDHLVRGLREGLA